MAEHTPTWKISYGHDEILILDTEGWIVARLELSPKCRPFNWAGHNALLIASAPDLKAQRDELLQFCKWSATALKLLLDEVEIDAGHPEKYEADFQLLIDLGVVIARTEKGDSDGR